MSSVQLSRNLGNVKNEWYQKESTQEVGSVSEVKMSARWFFIVLSFIGLGCNAASPEHLRTFQDAQSAFDAGEYRQSAILYEQLLDQGVRSGAVYYNLGNAWTKTDDPVRAVAAYYHAKRYIPNDPHLNANLQAILASNGGTIPSQESSFMELLFFWQNLVGYHVKIWISLALTVLACLGGVLYLFRQSKRLKRFLMGSAILVAIALASVGYDWYRFEGVEQVIVTANVLLRKGNSEQYEPAFVSPIPFGTLAIVLDERSGWYFLRVSNGQEGWLPCSQTFRL
jgi:tetratricopeptide (TPR) repeat protein